jgi:hypothetical protein
MAVVKSRAQKLLDMPLLGDIPAVLLARNPFSS